MKKIRYKKEFIQIVPQSYNGRLGLLPKEEFFNLVTKVASENDYDTKIISTGELKISFISWVKSNDASIIHLSSWGSYIDFLLKHHQAVIFANDRVAKSFIACFFGCYTIFMSHQSRLPPIWWQRQIFLFFVKRFDAIKVSNPFEKEELVKHGVKPERIHYIPLSVDYEFFGKKSIKQEKAKIRKKYKIQPDEKVFLFLANIRRFKRVNTALRAMKLLKDKGLSFRFIVVGQDMLATEKQPTLKEIAEKLGINENVVITGWVTPKEARSIMNISDICINSSIHEGQCLVVYEAAAAGLPLCVSNIGSFTSVFTKSALFHDPEDEKKLAENIQYYLKYPRIAKKHAVINKKIVKERCDYEVVKKKLKKLFNIKMQS